MSSRYSKRSPKEFNKFRAFVQWLVVSVGYKLFYRIKCDYRVIGRENLPKGFYIVASNHISAVDPFLVCDAVQRPVAYMAKEELFESFFPGLFLNWMGAFAVNREKLQVSTIKTALGIKQTDWVLGLFPQGTREVTGSMDNVTRGFAALAKTLKCDIVPIGITGALKKDRAFGGQITLRIGEPIPYMEDTSEMVKIWSEKIADLTEEERK